MKEIKSGFKTFKNPSIFNLQLIYTNFIGFSFHHPYLCDAFINMVW